MARFILEQGAFAFIAARLVKSLAKYAAGSGISEIKCILAGFIMREFLGFWTYLIKSLTLPLVIASGLSVGKEGPSVHMACAVGNLVASRFSKFSHSQGRMRDILTASSAAGVAVAFGSPIGGVLFSIEEMSQTFSIKTMWRSFTCALVATVTLAVRAVEKYEENNVSHFEAVTLAIITAIIGYPNRFLRIDMTESMSILFRECDNGGDYENLCQTSYQWEMTNSLLLATILRTLLLIISYGCKVPAGIFVPSMAIAAALSGVMRITVTVVVIMFELTGALTYILPTMIVLLVTKAVGDLLGITGIADEAIKFNGYPFLERDEHIYDANVAQVMRRDLHSIRASGMTVRDIEQFLASTTVKGFPIVTDDENRTLTAYIERAELEFVMERARRTQDLPPETVCWFVPDSSEQGNTLWSAIGIDEDVSVNIQHATATPGILKLWPWVNQTPLSVSSRLPLEVVMQLFKRMGWALEHKLYAQHD
ncbi:hypothetical protein EWM64_g1559 [Hericium alpestre]|uniref:Chloride channel protein n=1 Tax=Hericium alpestre TaxID=135208 RepID=A0A4Z0A948_9AGAM|nr:hypothetical protein EWM64_g1559 [Hericium alpestre]